MAYFDPSRPLFTIKVRDQPMGPKLGPRVLKHERLYMLGCRWGYTEQQKWQEFKVSNHPTNPMPRSAGTADKNPPYTDNEKAYIKKNWRSEYHFLLQHGLKIYNEKDRAEGRSILRAFMEEDTFEEESDDEDTFKEESEDDEYDLQGHQADYNFSSSQLDWIEKYYRNSENFMMCHGLKFYDDDDVEEAKAIADVMMAQDKQSIS